MSPVLTCLSSSRFVFLNSVELLCNGGENTKVCRTLRLQGGQALAAVITQVWLGRVKRSLNSRLVYWQSVKVILAYFMYSKLAVFFSTRSLFLFIFCGDS